MYIGLRSIILPPLGTLEYSLYTLENLFINVNSAQALLRDSQRMTIMSHDLHGAGQKAIAR